MGKKKGKNESKSTHLLEKLPLVRPAEIKGHLVVRLHCHGRSACHAKDGNHEGKGRESRHHLVLKVLDGKVSERRGDNSKVSISVEDLIFHIIRWITCSRPHCLGKENPNRQRSHEERDSCGSPSRCDSHEPFWRKRQRRYFQSR